MLTSAIEAIHLLLKARLAIRFVGAVAVFMAALRDLGLMTLTLNPKPSWPPLLCLDSNSSRRRRRGASTASTNSSGADKTDRQAVEPR